MTQSTPAPNIMVIEDDPDTAELVADVLQDHFQAPCVTLASSIGDALDNNLSEYSLVLCDFNLPDGTGLEALPRLLDIQPDLVVIMVTGEHEISTAVQAIKAGAYDYVVKSSQFLSKLALVVEKNLAIHHIKLENQRLARELEASLDQLSQSNRQLERMVRQLEQMALTDPLTGLANRRHLNEVITQMFAESARYGTDLSCIMIDLDGFKKLNDSMGHQSGDEVLKLLGRVVAANCREADAAARYGGDEFVILLPQTSGTTAVNLAQRIRQEFAQATAHLAPRGVEIGMSLGVACTTTSHPLCADQLIRHADDAMYSGKELGMGRIMVCNADGKSATEADSTNPTHHSSG